MLVAQNSLGSVCPVPLTVRGNDNTGWDPARARRTPAEVEAEALRMGYVAPAERDDSSTGGSTVDLT